MAYPRMMLRGNKSARTAHSLSLLVTKQPPLKLVIMFVCTAPTSNQAMRVHVEHSSSFRGEGSHSSGLQRATTFPLVSAVSVHCTVGTFDAEPWCKASRQYHHDSLRPLTKIIVRAWRRGSTPHQEAPVVLVLLGLAHLFRTCLYPLEQRCLRKALAP